MASRIKGITLEINGSTTGLESALKSVNSNISQTQRALKDVDRLLKLDPKNTELLQQKQKYLNDLIDQTKTKLEAEKEALQLAAEQDIPADKMEALKREVEETTIKLKEMEEQAGAAAGAMDTGTQQATEKVQSFGDKVGAAGAKLKEVGDKVSAVGEKIKGVGTGLSTHVTAPIVAVAGASVAAFKEVDEGLDIVVQKTGATGEALEQMQKSVKNIASEIPTDFETAGTAVGEVNTRFGLTGDALEELSTKFIKFADLNNTDVTNSIDMTQKALGAFGLGAESAGSLLDAMNATGQRTGVSMDTLMSGLVNNGTAFQEMGLSAEQAVEAMGQIEVSGANQQTVMNGLRKALKNAAKEGVPLNQALEDLQNSILNGTDGMDGLTASYELFGKSGDQIYGAVKNGTLDFSALADAATDSSGSIEAAFEGILDGPDKMKVAMNNLKVAGSEVGAVIMEMLVPVIERATEVIQAMREKWNGLSETQQKLIIVIAGIAAAIGPVLVVIGTVVSAVGSIISTVGTLMTSIQAVSTVMGTVGTPVLAIVAAIAAVIAILVALYNTNDEFRAKVQEVWTAIQELVSAAIEAIKNVIMTVAEAIRAFWTEHGEQIKAVASAVWQFIGDTVTAYLEVVRNIIQTVTAVISGDWEGAWNGIKNTLAAIWEMNKGIIEAGINAAQTILGTILEAIKAKFEEIWNGIKDTLSTIWEGIKSTVESGISAARDTLFGVLDAIGGKFSEIWEGAKDTVSGAIEFIKGLFNFEWHLPDIALPHFSIDGDFSLVPPSVPHVSVDWYRKAMDKAQILSSASIFGYDAKTNSLLGGGEAGREVVSGEDHLYSMIGAVVDSKMGALADKLARIEKYMPVLVRGQQRPVVLETGAAVGGLGKPMNAEFEKFAERDKWQ